MVAVCDLCQRFARDVDSEQLAANARIGSEVDVCAALGPVRVLDFVRHLGKQHPMCAARGRDEEDVVVVIGIENLVRIRSKKHPFSVGREIRAELRDRVVRELFRSAAIRIHEPDFAFVRIVEERSGRPVMRDLRSIPREAKAADREIAARDPLFRLVGDADAEEVMLFVVLVESEHVVF